MNEEDNKVNDSEKSYYELLVNIIASLRKDIEFCEGKIKSSQDFTAELEERKEKAKIELEKNEKELEKAEKKSGLNLSSLVEKALENRDKKIVRNAVGMSELSQSLNELKTLKKQTTDKKELQRINRAIFDQKQMLIKLRKQNNKFSNRQRHILVAKSKVDKLRANRINRQEEKVFATEGAIEQLQAKSSQLGPSMLDGLKGTVYEIKEEHYLRRLEHQWEVLIKLKDSKNLITDARALASDRVQALRESRNKSMRNPDLSKMMNQPNASTAVVQPPVK